MPEFRILDLGCGPGFFNIEIAKLLSDNGKIFATDIQIGMLNKIHKKIYEKSTKDKIILHQCSSNKIGINTELDFAFAFYSMHENPDHKNLFNEMCDILKPKTKFFIAEPIFHVSNKEFKKKI